MTRRDEIYHYICAYADSHSGPTPSIREISIHFKRNYTTIYRHIEKLEKEKRILRRDGKIVVTAAQWVLPLPDRSPLPPVAPTKGSSLFLRV